MSVAIGAFAAVAVASSAAWWFSNNTVQARFVAKCEAELMDRLRSPSTYNRRSVTDIRREPATVEQFLGIETPEKAAEWRALAQANPTLKDSQEMMRQIFNARPHDFAFVYLEYEAANGFGVPIRSTVRCDDFFEEGKEPDLRFFRPRIDGETNLEWTVNQME